MTENKGVMIYCEVADGRLVRSVGELFGWGEKLAIELGEELCALLIGNNLGDISQELTALGASKVYLVDDPLLRDYQSDSYAMIAEKVLRQVTPKILMMSQTAIGRDLAPRLAFKLDTVACLDCVNLAIDPGSGLLLKTKPVHGGKAHAVFSCECFPQIVTVRTKNMLPPEIDTTRQAEVIPVAADLNLSVIRPKVLQKVKEDSEEIPLEDASVVVVGGRGIGSADGFNQLEELAKLLKGTVGATRPPCDNGWIEDTRQIGLTGKIVFPDLYIAIALSGSSQHMSGCSGSKCIIAINKDPEANIFREARFGVVGDWKKVIPALIDRLKNAADWVDS